MSCQFGACHSDAFLIFAPMLIQYAILFLRRKASLARTTLAHISFLFMFPLCEEVLATPVWRVLLWHVYLFGAYVDPVCSFPFAKASLACTTLAHVSICAHFSFLRRSVVYSSLARFSMARISVCVFSLCAWYCLNHIFINLMKFGCSVM